MKHGKKPTRSQKQELKAMGLNHENWLVAKSEPHRLTLVHRATGTVKILPQKKDERCDI